MKLYELAEQMKAVIDLDLEETIVKDTLESLELSLVSKLDNIFKFIKNLEGESFALRGEVKRLSDKRKSVETKRKAIKQYAEDCVNSLPERKFKNNLFDVKFQKNPPKLQIEDINKIPEAYYQDQEPVLDLRTLLTDIKNGEVIEGVGLIQEESLRIR